jgi:Na+/H+-dicarboxylate symporter
LGVVLGGFLPADRYPAAYDTFRLLSKAFIQLIKSIIVPILLSTIVVGIAQTGDMRSVGRLGGKALVYFEVVTTVALFLGLGIAHWMRPGEGLPLKVEAHAELAKPKGALEIALHAFPSNVFKHAAEGDVLPVVVFATLFGVALTQVGDRAKPLFSLLENVAEVMLRYTDMVMKLTPLGVFGAMAYNVSHMAAGHEVDGVWVKGWTAVGTLLGSYAKLVGSLYLALFLLVVGLFVPILYACGVRPLRFLRAVRVPALTAFSTASSEAALPRLLEEVVRFGVPRRIASFVIPTGYSFNLDGSTLYLVLASLTIAQAAKIPMTLGQELLMVFTFMLTSKGVAGVPRATLVIIAGTCASFGLPGEAGVAMLLAVDEVMDMARSTTNVMGNAVASVVVARWEGALVLGAPDEMAGLSASQLGAQSEAQSGIHSSGVANRASPDSDLA